MLRYRVREEGRLSTSADAPVVDSKFTHIGWAVADALRKAGDAPGASRLQKNRSPDRTGAATREKSGGAVTASPPRDGEETHCRTSKGGVNPLFPE